MSDKLFYLVCMMIAGAAGTLARYSLSGVVYRYCGHDFFWGTLVVNGCGCLLFGVVYAVAAQHASLDDSIRMVVLVGFLGAFTTFSTFAFETGQLVLDANWLLAAANIAAQNMLGLIMFFGGLTVGRLV
jgi:fluoride exporter